MSRRPSVSRVRENRTHGLKGGWGTGLACKHRAPDPKMIEDPIQTWTRRVGVRGRAPLGTKSRFVLSQAAGVRVTW